jgi:transcriptional antiterminator RfaH
MQGSCALGQPTALAQHWAVARTPPQFGAERRAAQLLGDAGFATYAPRYRQVHVLRGKRAQRVMPLFPSYLLVLMTPHQVRSVIAAARDRVTELLMSGDMPARLAHSEVARLRASEDRDGFVVLDLRSPFARGERVRVADGVFIGYRGVCEDMDAQARVAVLLSMMGRKVRVMLGAEQLEAA